MFCIKFGDVSISEQFLMIHIPLPREGFERHFHFKNEYSETSRFIFRKGKWVYVKARKPIGPLNLYEKYSWCIFLEKWEIVPNYNWEATDIYFLLYENIKKGDFKNWLVNFFHRQTIQEKRLKVLGEILE